MGLLTPGGAPLELLLWDLRPASASETTWAMFLAILVDEGVADITSMFARVTPPKRWGHGRDSALSVRGPEPQVRVSGAGELSPAPFVSRGVRTG